MNAQDNIDLIPEQLKEPHLYIRIKSGQNPCRVVVIKDLPTEFNIEFVIKTVYPLKNR